MLNLGPGDPLGLVLPLPFRADRSARVASHFPRNRASVALEMGKGVSKYSA
jgi:hypothetical protein